MPKCETFEDAGKYLDTLASLEAKPADTNLRRLMRLDRMKEFLALACCDVGDPYSLKVVHVAGTKGKGSVVAMITAMLTEANFRVGAYTSPHVTSVEERISIGGHCISRDRFVDLLSKTTTAIEESCKLQPTYFEILTVCALRAFLEDKTDVAILEIGLGGRIDCTNIMPNVACAITNISIDHTEWLGDDIASIAREKAGVIKGSPVVSARQKPEALDVIKEVSEEKGSPLLIIGEDVRLGSREVLEEGQKVSVSTWKRDFHDLILPLRGVRQHENLGVALGVIEILGEREDMDVQSTEVRRALRSVRIPARMEFFPGRPGLIIDGSHNEASIENLVHHIRHDVAPARVITIFGMASDKKVSACLGMACSVSDLMVLTEIGNSRSVSVEELETLLPEDLPMENVRGVTDPAAAYQIAVDESGPDDLIVCMGSFYLAGIVRALVLEQRCQESIDSQS